MATPEPPSFRPKVAADESRTGWRMAGVGFEVASEVAAGALLGWLFDRWRGHGNIGVLVGSIVGIAVGLWSLIRTGLKLNRELDQNRQKIGYPPPTPPEKGEPGYDEHQAQDDDWHERDNWNNDADRN